MFSKNSVFASGIIVGTALLAGMVKTSQAEVFVGQPLSVIVDYNRTVEEVVERGQYTLSDPDISSENFSVTKTGLVRIEIYMVYFDQPITSEEVIRELEGRGLRPMTLPELLALGAKYPFDESKTKKALAERDLGINALGTRRAHPNGYYSDVAFIRWVHLKNSDGRIVVGRWLGLTWYELNWLGENFFAAVCEEFKEPVREKPELKPKTLD